MREVLGLDDVVFHLSITPNRPDAMGIVGVARDLAAHFNLPFTDTSRPPVAPVDSLDGASAVVEAPDRCPRLVVRVATVTMGESPEWMQRRLRLAGMRPISNVVDVTNYVMLERCRPLHAFDLGRLAGRGLVVRLATPGEKMTTLDGVERTLHADDLLICDAERAPQAIAGIMGGRDSEVDGETTRDPARVGVLRAGGHRGVGEAARPAFRGERALRARHRSERRRERRGARWSCSRRSRAPRSSTA